VKDSQEGPVFGAQVRVGSDTVEVATMATPAQGSRNSQCSLRSLGSSRDEEGFEESKTTATVAEGRLVLVSLTLQPQIKRSTLEVTDSVPAPVEQSSSRNNILKPAEVKSLPTNPAAVSIFCR